MLKSDCGFFVILGILLIKWNIAKNCILFDKMALKLSYGVNIIELFCMYLVDGNKYSGLCSIFPWWVSVWGNK